MKKRGSCGLKQAREETSCRLLAARCLAVQNSFTHVGTERVSPLKSLADVCISRVAAPNSLNWANCSSSGASESAFSVAARSKSNSRISCVAMPEESQTRLRFAKLIHRKSGGDQRERSSLPRPELSRE